MESSTRFFDHTGDIAFFDPSDLSRERDASAQALLQRRLAGVSWEATNQAAVHLWYHDIFGYRVEPLSSSDEAVATWPETATSVGVRLHRDGALRVVAPCGLDDLFAMVLRRNPRRVSCEEFRRRLESRQILRRWPRVRVIET
jgi:hypothetical protein